MADPPLPPPPKPTMSKADLLQEMPALHNGPRGPSEQSVALPTPRKTADGNGATAITGQSADLPPTSPTTPAMTKEALVRASAALLQSKPTLPAHITQPRKAHLHGGRADGEEYDHEGTVRNLTRADTKVMAQPYTTAALLLEPLLDDGQRESPTKLRLPAATNHRMWKIPSIPLALAGDEWDMEEELSSVIAFTTDESVERRPIERYIEMSTMQVLSLFEARRERPRLSDWWLLTQKMRDNCLMSYFKALAEQSNPIAERLRLAWNMIPLFCGDHIDVGLPLALAEFVNFYGGWRSGMILVPIPETAVTSPHPHGYFKLEWRCLERPDPNRRSPVLHEPQHEHELIGDTSQTTEPSTEVERAKLYAAIMEIENHGLPSPSEDQQIEGQHRLIMETFQREKEASGTVDSSEQVV